MTRIIFVLAVMGLGTGAASAFYLGSSWDCVYTVCDLCGADLNELKENKASYFGDNMPFGGGGSRPICNFSPKIVLTFSSSLTLCTFCNRDWGNAYTETMQKEHDKFLHQFQYVKKHEREQNEKMRQEREKNKRQDQIEQLERQLEELKSK